MNLRWKNGIEGDQELDDPYITLTKRDYEGMKNGWVAYGFGLGFGVMGIVVFVILLIVAFMQ